MSSRFLMAVVVGFSLAVPAYSADEPTAVPVTARLAAQSADALATLLDKLHGEMPPFVGNVDEVPFFEHVHQLSKKLAINIVINEESFRAAGEQDIKTKTPNLKVTQTSGMTTHQFLDMLLSGLPHGATYLLRGNAIEIMTAEYAARTARTTFNVIDDGRKVLKEPLVSAVFKEKPLNEAVATIAERYDLTAIVTPQAGDARTGFITARLLNVPADRALELLALQADLRVVRKGAAFLITSREHADALFLEEIEKQRAKIELDKFRQMPPPRPEAPVPQPNPDQAVFLKLDLGPQLKPQK
jgi:hypothetical protein